MHHLEDFRDCLINYRSYSGLDRGSKSSLTLLLGSNEGHLTELQIKLSELVSADQMWTTILSTVHCCLRCFQKHILENCLSGIYYCVLPAGRLTVSCFKKKRITSQNQGLPNSAVLGLWCSAFWLLQVFYLFSRKEYHSPFFLCFLWACNSTFFLCLSTTWTAHARAIFQVIKVFFSSCLIILINWLVNQPALPYITCCTRNTDTRHQMWSELSYMPSW